MGVELRKKQEWEIIDKILKEIWMKGKLEKWYYGF